MNIIEREKMNRENFLFSEIKTGEIFSDKCGRIAMKASFDSESNYLIELDTGKIERVSNPFYEVTPITYSFKYTK